MMESELREALETINNRMKNIDDTLKKMLDFFYSMEEMNVGEDSKYEDELKKDGFHPPIA